MKHTPYGYEIIGGKAVINEEQADIIRKLCENYLSGMSFKGAAKAVGLDITHGRAKQIMQNKRYLGDDFYPPILTEETVKAIETERLKREVSYKGVRYTRKVEIKIPTQFNMKKPVQNFIDPVKQAEYVYSLMESEV